MTPEFTIWEFGLTTLHRELIFNAFSLACGFAGNLFLLLHFTSRVRYIVALPLAILCWLVSSAIVSTFPSR